MYRSFERTMADEGRYELIDTPLKVLTAVDELKAQDKNTFFGCDCEGVRLSRTGQLCLLQIAVKKHVYLFDIVVLGVSAFQSGKNATISFCVYTP